MQAHALRVGRRRLTGRVRAGLDSGSVVLTAGAGYGKTIALEQALSEATGPFAWVGCSPAARSPGMFVTLIVDAIATAVPGSTDALAETMSAARERVEALEVTRELIAELSRLLVEPLIVVVDDAEFLDGADGSLEVLGELLRADVPLLHVAVACRTRLAVRVAKRRAAGRLIELTAADLAFEAEECAELLRRRTGLDPSSERVEEVMELTEGWPLGIALAAGLMERAKQAGDVAPALADLRSAPDLRSYLSEELVDSLEPELREAAIESSVVAVVAPAVERALELPEGFRGRVERAGLLVRRAHDGRGFVYHPLLREFLLERLRAGRSEPDWRALHAAVAPALHDEGDAVGAIEHWLEGQSWPEAVAALEREGPRLARTALELVSRWLSLLPEAERAYPTMRALEGQLLWRAGDMAAAIVALRDAIDGFRRHPDARAEWMARSILVDLLWATDAVDELEAAVEGWDRPAAAGASGLGPAATLYAAIGLATFARFGQSERLAEAAKRHSEAALLPLLEALRTAFFDLPRGRIDLVRARLDGAVSAMGHFDPFQRRLHVLALQALVLGDCSDAEEALGAWLRIRDAVRGRRAPVVADATHAWCALLHARAGRLADAEAELAQHRRLEVSARYFVADLAPAVVASLRGDAPATLAAAERTLATVAAGPILFRYWAQADLVSALADVGLLERAGSLLADTLALVDEHYPGELGRYPRGRLFGLRAWLRHLDGESAGVDVDLRALWDAAGESLPYALRRDWERLRLPVWGALERGNLEPESAVEQIAKAFPAGLELVPFLDHPLRAVRGAALAPAISSGDPHALSRLVRLRRESDVDLAAAALLASKRLALALPPLRFELLGRFDVRRGAWRARAPGGGRSTRASCASCSCTSNARCPRTSCSRRSGPTSTYPAPRGA